MTKVRDFSENGHVRAALGGAYSSGALTYVSYCKRAGGNEWMVGFGSGATNYVTMGAESGSLLLYKGGGSNGPSAPVGKWCLFVATKGSGSVTPKYYIYDFTAEEWVSDEVSGSSPMGNNPEAPPEYIDFGVWSGPGSEQFLGNMAAAAIFKRALSKAEVHELVSLGSVSEWMKLTPNGLWRMDEALPADLTGGGADATEAPNTALVEEAIPLEYGPLEGGGGGPEGATVKVKVGESLVTAKRWVKQGGILVPA